MAKFLVVDGREWLLPDMTDIDAVYESIQLAMKNGTLISVPVASDGSETDVTVNMANVAQTAIIDKDAFERASYESPTGRAAIRLNDQE
jgi:hypothetical protein